VAQLWQTGREVVNSVWCETLLQCRAQSNAQFRKLK
jgi:hypothetical protein